MAAKRESWFSPRSILVIYFFAFLVILFFVLGADPLNKDIVYVDGKPVHIPSSATSKEPSLYHYLEIPDKTFKWDSDFKPIEDKDNKVKIYDMKLTSLQWLTDAEVTPSTWKHKVTIVRPDDAISTENASVFITGCNLGDGSESCHNNELKRAISFASQSKLLTVILYTIPNQTTVFTRDPKKQVLFEDAMISFTWETFMTAHLDRPDWIAYFPMVKSALRCMDAVEQWAIEMVRQPGNGFEVPIKQWYIWGASKRGATTWLLSAYLGAKHPQRIIGSAPIVYDALNFKKVVMDIMPTKLGAFATAFSPYANSFDSFINNKEASDALVKHIDITEPWYHDGIGKVDKLAINSAMDEFFLLGNDLWWYSLVKATNPAKSSRLLVPMANHSFFQGSDWLFAALAGHVGTILAGKQMPLVTETVSAETGAIKMCSPQKPTKSQLWSSSPNPTIPQRLDYRMTKPIIEGGCLPPAVQQNGMCISIAQWVTKDLDITQEGDLWCSSYQDPGVVPEPIQWTSHYIISTWNEEGKIGGPLTVNTPIITLPNTVPFPTVTCLGPTGPKTCPVDLFV